MLIGGGRLHTRTRVSDPLIDLIVSLLLLLSEWSASYIGRHCKTVATPSSERYRRLLLEFRGLEVDDGATALLLGWRLGGGGLAVGNYVGNRHFACACGCHGGDGA
ncbi:hypothetical protein BCR44DRAFT_388087 [Catenaria anguillulae PL171]|uniref:Uncharacterized protein n=1 Tax=Catenaria anguillulae PL171 TaxID=765915 RepID=A0A1Y2HVT0_9FUNG|nr:hypothetical protein BCR44DRAFT_388087 [Catenaria anguillulae PL171]